jgi:hypothetical protein
MLLERAEEAKGLAEDDAAASRAAVAEAHAAAQRLLSAQANHLSTNASSIGSEPTVGPTARHRPAPKSSPFSASTWSAQQWFPDGCHRCCNIVLYP